MSKFDLGKILTSGTVHKFIPLWFKYLIYFCVFKYAWKSNKRSGTRLKTESETGERRFFFLTPHHALWACEARALRARNTLTPHSADFFTDFEKKTDCFAVYTKEVNSNNLTSHCESVTFPFFGKGIIQVVRNPIRWHGLLTVIVSQQRTAASA